MKIDLDELQDSLGYLDSMGELERCDFGDRLIEAAPLLLEAFSVLANQIACGEVVLPDLPDGSPASGRLQEALRRAAAAINAEDADHSHIPVSAGVTPQLDPTTVRAPTDRPVVELEVKPGEGAERAAAMLNDRARERWAVDPGEGTAIGKAVRRWARARDKRVAAAERIAEHNASTGYAPSLLQESFRAAERAEIERADELYEAVTHSDVALGEEVSAGVLGLRWTREPPHKLATRDGEVHNAELVRCAVGRHRTERGKLDRDRVHAALLGLVVRTPSGVLSRVAGVESPASMQLHEGSPVGLLLLPVPEPVRDGGAS